MNVGNLTWSPRDSFSAVSRSSNIGRCPLGPATALGTRDMELKDAQSWPSGDSQAEVGKRDLES